MGDNLARRDHRIVNNTSIVLFSMFCLYMVFRLSQLRSQHLRKRFFLLYYVLLLAGAACSIAYLGMFDYETLQDGLVWRSASFSFVSLQNFLLLLVALITCHQWYRVQLILQFELNLADIYLRRYRITSFTVLAVFFTALITSLGLQLRELSDKQLHEAAMKVTLMILFLSNFVQAVYFCFFGLKLLLCVRLFRNQNIFVTNSDRAIGLSMVLLVLFNTVQTVYSLLFYVWLEIQHKEVYEIFSRPVLITIEVFLNIVIKLGCFLILAYLFKPVVEKSYSYSISQNSELESFLSASMLSSQERDSQLQLLRASNVDQQNLNNLDRSDTLTNSTA